jgi:hypothetical protein
MEAHMKRLLLIASAAALLSTPAMAEAKQKGPKGKSHVAGKVHKGQGQNRGGAYRNYIGNWNDHWDGDGYYGGYKCPPGLAKKTPSCVPPGQVGRPGGRVPSHWGRVDWDEIPRSLRERYMLNNDWRYSYYGRRLYVVDPATDLITRIINGIRF